MRATENLTNTFSKQRLRVELNNHIEDFLHKGGRIEVLSGLTELSASARLGRWPAAAETVSLHGPDTD
jgi:hypothetical protein